MLQFVDFVIDAFGLIVGLMILCLAGVVVWWIKSLVCAEDWTCVFWYMCWTERVCMKMRSLINIKGNLLHFLYQRYFCSTYYLNLCLPLKIYEMAFLLVKPFSLRWIVFHNIWDIRNKYCLSSPFDLIQLLKLSPKAICFFSFL